MSTSPPRDEWRERASLFDSASRQYRDGRPGYPPEVFALLAERCSLGIGSRVLEIGAGAGQATMSMLEMGAHVTAVEPGAGLAEQLSARGTRFPLRVLVSNFETAIVDAAAYDLVASATAFHWVDNSLGLAKAGAALRDHGWLALWWTVFGDPSRADPFQEALEAILRAKAPELLLDGQGALVYALDIDSRSSEIASAGVYESAEHHLLKWEGRHSAAEIRALFATFSPWLALPSERRVALLDDLEELARRKFADSVIRPYQTIVYLAQRKPREALSGGT